MAQLLKPDDFLSLEQPLMVDLESGEMRAEVALAVESVKTLPSHRFREQPFSVVVAGPRDPALSQGTYRIRHPSLGMIELFLVPIGQDAQSMRYEAVFN